MSTYLGLALLLAVAATARADCSLTTGKGVTFDLSPLTKTGGTHMDDNWVVKETREDEDSSDQTAYTYFLNVGAPVVAGKAFGNVTDGHIAHASVVQQNDDTKTKYVAARSDDKCNLIYQHDQDLRLEFQATNSSFVRDVTIAFLCANKGLGQPTFFEEFNQANYGRYVFIWETCAACAVGTDIRNACPGTAAPTRSECSSYTKELGKALIIALILLIVAALLISMAYKRLPVTVQASEAAATTMSPTYPTTSNLSDDDDDMAMLDA